MKKMLSLLLPLMLFGIVVACSNKVIKDEDVMNFVKEYKIEQYTIKDPTNAPTESEIATKVKGYLSEEVFNKHNANRIFHIAPYIAKKTNKSIELEDVILERKKENDNGTIDYNFILKLKFEDDKSSEVVEKKGQLTISNEDGLKITCDWEEKTTKIDNEVF